MSDTVAAPSSLPEVAYPPAISLREAWPWMLLGLALLALFYFVGVDEGAASVVPRPLPCTSGSTTGATCSASPATEAATMLRNLLICGLIAGSAAACSRPASPASSGEGPVGQAIAFEGQQAKAAGQAEEAPVVSRTVQKSFGLLTAAVVYGLSLGGLFALAFAASTGASASRARRARAS